MSFLVSPNLYERLCTTAPDEATILEFLEGQSSNLTPAPSISTFISLTSDLPDYLAAVAWWPKRTIVTDLPLHMVAPPIYELLNQYQLGPNFKERLIRRYNTVVTWLEANSYDVSTPNTLMSPLERKRSLNAAAVRRHRVAQTDPQLNSVTQLYHAYISECKARKASDAAFALRCNEAFQAWQTARAAPISLSPLEPTASEQS